MTIQCPKCKAENPDESKFCNECGLQIDSIDKMPAPPTKTLEAPKEELTTGSTFAGRYQIIEELGRGGMGRVYKATDTKIKEKVALKLIKPEIASDKKTLERFGNELRIARKIVHKNVGRMYDINEEKGTHYITMEYVSGQDLKGFIRQSGQMAIGTSISVAKQVCEGLSEAHKTGVIHRDLKPSNIMIDREGNVRIMDFGIARSLKEKGITGAGVMIGTPEYMSPEQAEAKEVDQRSDIYSLGVILYEMVTGRVPFEGDTALSIAMKHKGEVPKDPKDYNGQIPDDLNKLILKCLEKDKERRFQSAGEIQVELGNIEKGIPTADRAIPKRKPITSKEITVTFGLRKLLVPALAVVAVIIIAVFIWEPWSTKAPTPLTSDKPSVAILPFVDLSPQEDQAYFCDGLADELINRLTRIENLNVPARTSSFSFKGKELDIQEIGEKLDVENVLEGSIRKSGNKLRITVQLIKVDDGYPIWSERYERNMEDIFSLQDEISLAIVDNLKIELLGKEKIGFVKSYTQNLEAYDLYLRGRFFWNKRTEESLKKSAEYFQQAIEIDPSYAVAYAGLADSYITRVGWGFLPSKEAYPKAREAAQKALDIDELLAEAHNAIASVHFEYDWDWEGAEREYKRSIELNPRYPTAHHWYSEFLVRTGRFDEAVNEIELAKKLDPLSLIISGYRSVPYKYRGEYDKAIALLNIALEMDPNFIPTYRYLADTYHRKGDYEEALRIYKMLDFKGAYIGIIYAKMGKIAEAQRVLADLKNRLGQPTVFNMGIASIHFWLGENEKGFEYLDKAYKEKERNVSFLKVTPLPDVVRSDPRYKALLKKMNLE